MGKAIVAIIGSGNIGTDLMVKVLRHSATLEMAAMVGIDPASDGLVRAQRMGVPVIGNGIEGLLDFKDFDRVQLVFDATSAGAHARHNQLLQAAGKRVIDLTPAAIGPFVVPAVNLDSVADVPNLNMVTCGGQATIPMVAAIARVAKVPYAEIVASVSSRSAGPGTRANIDEFTETTARGVELVGGAARGKAIIILNPADPPLIMRDTVYALVEEAVDQAAIEASVHAMVKAVQDYVPGYRLKQQVQFDRMTDVPIAEMGRRVSGLKVTVFLEVEGAAHYLPAYAGNLDIMTAAALRTAERVIALSVPVPV